MLWIGYVPLCVKSPRYGCVRGGRTLRGHMWCKVFRSLDVLPFEGVTAVILGLFLQRVGSYQVGSSHALGPLLHMAVSLSALRFRSNTTRYSP